MAEDYLQLALLNFKKELQENGCTDISDLLTSNLRNEIHPLFAQTRWAKGYGQDTYLPGVYHRLEPALQLATLMLTEDCTLPWFHHLTFGRRTWDTLSRPPKVYLASRKIEHTKEGRETTKDILMKMAEVMTFMFCPRDYNDTYGSTYPRRKNITWIHKFRLGELPEIPEIYKQRDYRCHGSPCVVINTLFQDFFTVGFLEASMAYRYRMLFLFTLTLVHECAHAYYCFLGRAYHDTEFGKEEPLWSIHEKEAELGFSWETVTLGRIINPWNGNINKCPVLLSYHAEEFDTMRERKEALKKIFGPERNQLKWTRVPNAHGEFEWFDLDWAAASTWRGYGWFGARGQERNKKTLCVLQAIPMRWIVHWFREDEWETKRMMLRQRREYRPPPLGPTFTLIYQRDERGIASLHKPAGDQTDADPYLETVRTQGASMHLYDEYYAGDYDDRRSRR